MEMYLPIAEMSVNWVFLIGLGLGVGFLSGLFGVGGGFLLTPLLVFYGIPSTVAVGTTPILFVPTGGTAAITAGRTISSTVGSQSSRIVSSTAVLTAGSPGTGSVDHVEENCNAATVTLDAAALDELSALTFA